KQVQFTGFVPQATVSQYYGAADIFCFPSIREFGGAVVLEAMAHGLPCIVADYGGIGEYVTEEMGCKIELKSHQDLIEQLQAKIELLVEDTVLRQQMSVKAIERAKKFTWPQKAEDMLWVYHEAITQKANITFPGLLRQLQPPMPLGEAV
ncbi:MAG: glycosyltransferase family 4 protein, partial [Microcoleaceae cyanobacterium]